MKKPLLLAFLCAAALPVFAADNLINNGDFENDTKLSKSGLPRGLRMWFDLPEPPGLIQLSQDEKVSGNNSILIERTGPEGALSLSFPPVQVEPGRKYRFSCMVKLTDGVMDITFSRLDNGNQHINRPFDDAQTTTEGAKITNQGVSLPFNAIANPNDFTKLDLTFSIPDGVYFLALSARFNKAAGKAWVDDFELVPED